MFHARRGARFGYAAALFALANSVPAQASEDARSYVAQYELETPAGIARANETLSVRKASATSFVSVSSPNGALVSLPTQFAADGEIMANSFDPSVTCYNMATAALYSNEHAPTAPAAVYVRFGNDTITVPVTLASAATADGDRTVSGSGVTAFTASSDTAQVHAGMVVDAHITVRDGELSDVAFSETTLVGSPAKPISRMTCTLARASGNAPSAGTPVATLPG